MAYPQQQPPPVETVDKNFPAQPPAYGQAVSAPPLDYQQGAPMGQPGTYPPHQPAPLPGYQQGAPMGQPGVYPPQQPGTYPPHQPPPGVAVVATQPTVVVQQTVQFRDAPMLCSCPNCHNQVTSVVHREVGLLTWLLVGGLILLGLWLGCCLIPLCIDACKDAVHTCPVCNYQLGRWSQVS